ncbi:MAG: PEP-CTERM sorting domain-containing protein [Phycisphaeraceae bacterium]|nr:PEP-CTERM sorting domain-containing protein [Phycisphaeraceae bacterium]MBX3361484.1 PEP-CTERM sorting domain-containing protein [Phycisphaeraceae bacterium]MCW5768439.1 PEP-CTERM sorting domain-containing protein [Phycisphaeraceae bacterium]
MKKIISVLSVAALAGSACAVDFFGTADNTGYQGNSSSLNATHLLSAEIRGLETLWSSGGFAHANAGFGSVIGVDDFTSGGTSQAVYRVDNAFSGVPNLVQIATINSRPVSDLTVGNGKIYGVRNVGGSGSNLEVVEFDTSFNVTNTYDTGIAIAAVAAGGLAYDASSDSFYLTDPGADKLWNWSIGGSATLVGVNSFDFDNNDLAIDPNTGTLYAAIENVVSGAWEFGYFNKNNGQFNMLVSVANSSGSVGLAIPSPATLALIGLGGLVAGRRRR